MENAVIRKVFLLVALILVLPGSALAQKEHSSMLLKESSLVIRDSIASFDYKAGGEKVEGLLHGPAVTYTYHDPYYPLMARGEFEILFGSTDFKRDGGSSDSDDIIINVRGLLGYDILYHDNLVLTPYTGLGMRYWHNNVSGARDQSQTYYYIPVGVESVSSLMPTVDFGVRLEADYVFNGSANTEFNGDQGRNGEAVNDLDFGYGLRASVYISKQFEAVGVGFEPFVRYWNVEGSDGDWVHRPGYGAGGATQNFENFSTQRGETLIWGASLSVHF